MYMMKKVFFVMAAVLAVSTAAFAQNRPEWVDKPGPYGRATYENGINQGQFVYFMANSQPSASERRARVEVQRELNKQMAGSIATKMAGITLEQGDDELSDSETTDMQNNLASGILQQVGVKLPKYELLEWYIEQGESNGQKNYVAFVLARYGEAAIETAVEQIDVDKAVDATAKEAKKKGTIISDRILDVLTGQLEAAKEEIIEDIESDGEV
jgi:hypothetical protein